MRRRSTKWSADRSGLVRQPARRIVEEALEAEAGEVLGRGYYEHGAGERGYRNGYRVDKVQTAEGVIEFAVPQVSEIRPSRFEVRYGRCCVVAPRSWSASR